MSFLRTEAERRVKASPLLRLEVLLDWKALGETLGDLGRSGYGPSGYDPIQLLKGLVLQTWHSLSDPALEEALRLRMDFMLFTGFDHRVPDETTFCRFRNLLIHQGKWEALFQEVNRQLQEAGLQVAPTKGAVLDATLIESAARPRKRPRKHLETQAVDREEDEVAAFETTGETHLSVDPDATWLKKGRKSYFGYKAFVTTDSTHGAIHRVYVTPAHVSEMGALEAALGDVRPEKLYADKGYASAANRDLLRKRGVRGGLMYKAARGRPLSPWQRKANKVISKSRYIVEQAFGTLKRRFSFARASYMTRVKVEAQLILKAIAFNLVKALRQERCAYS